MLCRVRTALFALFMCLFLLPQTGWADDEASPPSKSSSGDPTLSMNRWKHSSPAEQKAFLFGFVAAIEMETAWQGDNSLPIGKSIAPSWKKGLSGVSISEMSEALDRYADQHPEKLDKHVLGVLASLFVRPKLSPDERKEAKERHRQIRQNR